MIQSVVTFEIQCLLGLAVGSFCAALVYSLYLLVGRPRRRRERQLAEIQLARQAADVELRLVASRAMRRMLADAHQSQLPNFRRGRR